MSYNTNLYNFDPHIAEVYDQSENYTDDAGLLLRLMSPRPGPWQIFEPFCGTGRILIPLARAGHQLTGLDQSPVLLARCREKLAQAHLTAALIEGDVITDTWPGGFDLVVMGGNCLYELASMEEQENCIRAAAAALKPGGYLFVDNNHMEGELTHNWRDTSVRPSFPSGLCADGVRLESTIQVVWFDAAARLARFERVTRALSPNGRETEYRNAQQKHPVSTGEVRGWIEAHGLTVESLFGSRDGEPYTDAAPRAIFWARKGA